MPLATPCSETLCWIMTQTLASRWCTLLLLVQLSHVLKRQCALGELQPAYACSAAGLGPCEFLDRCAYMCRISLLMRSQCRPLATSDLRAPSVELSLPADHISLSWCMHRGFVWVCCRSRPPVSDIQSESLCTRRPLVCVRCTPRGACPGHHLPGPVCPAQRVRAAGLRHPGEVSCACVKQGNWSA